MSAPATALSVIYMGLAAARGPDNYQRGQLQAARDHLEVDNVPAAVHALGDAVDHAHRPGWTETRDEVAVCIKAFRILTEKAGGAA
ncbi:hypothetical protein ACWA7J_21705 [Leptothrix sp. BB-4]